MVARRPPKKPKTMRALTVNEVLKQKKKVFPFEGAWADAFGQPERTGVWFIWGNSGNGKSSFTMQLCKELCKYDRVAYDSLEEGNSMTMQMSLMRHNMQDVSRRFSLLNAESMEELNDRLLKRKSYNIVVIDSFQYTMMTYKDYIAMKEMHKDKLLIFISHANGKLPRGNSAVGVMYDASLKIWVEGFKAFSKGRFIGSTAEYTIWEAGAEKYWGGEKDDGETEPLEAEQNRERENEKET